MWCCRHKGLSGGAVAGIVVAVGLISFLLGLAVFAGYQMHRARRKAQAEVAFEAALQDSGLGLDDAFEQVCHCMTSMMLGWCCARICCVSINLWLRRYHKQPSTLCILRAERQHSMFCFGRQYKDMLNSFEERQAGCLMLQDAKDFSALSSQRCYCCHGLMQTCCTLYILATDSLRQDKMLCAL